MTILEIKGLTLASEQGYIVRNFELSVGVGMCHALIGESGSGKSMTSLAIGDLLPSSVRISAGDIRFLGRSLLSLSTVQRERLRGKEIAYILQEYAGALTPFIPIGKQLDETLRAHSVLDRKLRKECILQALEYTRLPDHMYDRYPFQLSGGQMQRVSLAAALMLKPKLFIMDEPTTALDRTNAIEILRIISNLKEQTSCGILLISHDLRNVKRYADDVTVIKEGQLVESGPTQRILSAPAQAYTKRLLAAVPSLRIRPS
ncbi:ATP-binding cassette domain-containing protein [Paenibacillus terrae]|uniref:Peptide ABC transporter ATPase n=1 Tax=Paenibacillus terrae TaxID=159743 RepID=A0A0D7X4N1_9BACL|nr:ABC transporter ATP-binding protein [Paenibacillus terrae]KJD45923.1 peptide ABC transporter ATPase [Paenibacillus terrae]